MSSTKQDRVAPRTATDLERKYNFGQKFSEILGLIDDTRKDVDATSSEVRTLEQATSIQRDAISIISKATETIQADLGEVQKSVETILDADSFDIKVQGVEIDAGYTFDANGLNITQSGSEMQNLINASGMYVNRGGENVLTANSKGVVAKDLHAESWLTVGNNSRFEDYDGIRTGCFWVGD